MRFPSCNIAGWGEYTPNYLQVRLTGAFYAGNGWVAGGCWDDDITSDYPLVNIQKAIENGPVEIVDFPINSMVIFHGKMLVHQRVIPLNPIKSH